MYNNQEEYWEDLELIEELNDDLKAKNEKLEGVIEACLYIEGTEKVGCFW
jgi:hypothetical protein